MEDTMVTPKGLRAAAHAIIVDGEDGSSLAASLVGKEWARKLVPTFLANYEELMRLAGKHYPPAATAEVRLLQLCLDQASDDEQASALIREAMDQQ